MTDITPRPNVPISPPRAALASSEYSRARSSNASPAASLSPTIVSFSMAARFASSLILGVERIPAMWKASGTLPTSSACSL